MSQCHNRYTKGCPTCQRAHRIKDGRRELRIAQGTWQYRQPAELVRDHITKLRAAGMNTPAIAHASGVPLGTVYGIAQGRGYHVQGDNAARILAVATPIPTPPAGFVAALGPRRRAQALVAIGHSVRAQRARTGIAPAPFFRLLHGHSAHIAQANADAIDAMFRQWATLRGPSKHAITWAAKYGWVPPHAWDDIDDPACQPNLGTDEPDDNTVDEVAVARVVAGKAPFTALRNSAERAVAVATAVAAGRSRSAVARTAGISWARVVELHELGEQLIAERRAVAA